uniref:CUB domain-containing protein n=1 Tax=Heligmosomoides polygyrus TaxID=6339 RepID=A0A183FM04_HELPZ
LSRGVNRPYDRITYSTLRPSPQALPSPAQTSGCCPALVQTPTTSEFPDGLMTFVYDNDTCRTAVVATCSQTDPAFDLYAAIVANQEFFLDFGPNNITFSGTCNTTLQQW